MRASSSRRSSVVWFRGMVGWPSRAKVSGYGRTFPRKTAALTSERVPVPASPAGAKVTSCIGCRKPHFGSEYLYTKIATDKDFADVEVKPRGRMIRCTLGASEASGRWKTVLRRVAMFESSSRPIISRRLAMQFVRALCGSALFLLVHLPAAHGQSPDHSSDELRKLNQSVNALIKKVSPSVVQILVTGYGPLEEGERGNTNAVIGRQRAIGSGFVIDPSGYIVTNAHVVNGAPNGTGFANDLHPDGCADQSGEFGWSAGECEWRSGGSEYFYSVAVGRKRRAGIRDPEQCGERRLPAIAEVRPLAPR